MPDHFTQLREHAERFKARLAEVKRQLGRVDFEWYPYDSFTAFAHLDQLLTGENRSLFAGAKKILDAGCQDGEISFLLESLGHEVTALDHPTYNHNSMRGVRTLQEALHSRIRLCDVDIDRQFQIPGGKYDIAVLLGVLYHLRNPFYALEELASTATYCLMSTRIARCFPDGSSMPPNLPLAYLLGERELNLDETNYFIFSEAGLRTLLQRTHWEVLHFVTVGRLGDSDPVNPDRDERIFCLLKSRYGAAANVEFLQGWHEPEESGWRWTQRQFSARLRWNGDRSPRRVVVELFLSDDLMQQVSPLHLSISANGQALTSEAYRAVGSHQLVRTLPQSETGEFLMEFALSGVLPPSPDDPRERGVVVSVIRIE